MKTTISEVSIVDVDAIKVFVSRTRRREEFEQLKQSIDEVGLKMPIQIRDISTRPNAERKRPEGGLFKWELIVGEGRLLAHKELGKKKIQALVVDAPEAEVVGRFLAENMVRKPLPWAEKGRMVKRELDAGASLEEVATRFCITAGHAAKLLRIISKTAPDVAEEVAAMPMAEAELLANLPADHQQIVVETLRENPERQVKDVLKKAKQLSESGEELSKMALKKSLDRVGEDLKRTRESLKVIRLHHSLGVTNLNTLLQNKKIRAALVADGVNITKFESLVSQ